jgi:hypothetical protein
MSWRIGRCPWGDPAAEFQEQIERVRAIEDRELRERIAMERFAEQRKEDDERRTDGIHGVDISAI